MAVRYLIYGFAFATCDVVKSMCWTRQNLDYGICFTRVEFHLRFGRGMQYPARPPSREIAGVADLTNDAR